LKYPHVTVILTSLNHENFIADAIQSVLDQTYTDFEFFIIDDCSEDNSWEIIQSFDDPRITAIRNPERLRGAYGLNETILHHAKGEFVAIHHSDDVWFPEKLEKQVAFLETHLGMGAVFTQASLIDEYCNPFMDPDHHYQSAFRQPNRNRFEWLRYFFLEGNCLCHPSVLARRQALLDAGLYDRRLGQVTDFDLWVRLCLYHEIHILDEELTYFRIRDGEANQSGERPETYVRVRNEWHIVLGRLLLLNDEADFFNIFPEMRRFALSSGNHLPFLLAIRATETGDDFRMAFGLGLLYTLLADEDVAVELHEKYGFSYLKLITLSGQIDTFHGVDALGMKQCADELKNEIARIKNTFSWRLTKPLRLIANLAGMLNRK